MSVDKKEIDNEKANMDVEAGKKGDEKETKINVGAITAQVMNDPEALAAMQSRLAGMVGTLSGYYDTLPKSVKRRVKACKKLQVDVMKLEAKFHEEVHALECKYAALYDPLSLKRFEIATGKYEPTEEECDFPSDVEEDEEKSDEKLSEDVKNKVNLEKEDKEKDENTKGIPEFWLTVFKSIEVIAENIQDYDQPILEHLTDVRVKLHDDPMGFTLEFHFSPNEYFTNEVLTKYYELRCTVDEEDPFSFEGPEISKCKGCEINWNKGKNITVKTVTKKQKHKSKGSVRTVTKTVQNDSFFNFFSPPPIPEKEEDMDEETQALLSADFEIGEVIRQRLIPRAVLYFTGEALDDDDEYDEEDEEDEEEDEEMDDEEDDEPEHHHKGKAKHSKGGSGGNKKENPQECKQQ